MDENQDYRDRLEDALSEIARLRAENSALRRALALSNKNAEAVSGDAEDAVRMEPERPSTGEKVALFRSLFRGREDVYALRWETGGGRSGYSPVHTHRSDPRVCRRPRTECEQSGERLYVPLSDDALYRHLSGREVIGIYPLLKDDRCRFLAVDLDRESWREDAAELLRACERLEVPASLERSRSGAGAHLWIFFAEPVPAARARVLGGLLLGLASRRRYRIGLDSFDRMFPNQDLLPRGGFGNLIALPLQKQARLRGNSVFLDGSLQPVEDQWAYLQGVKRLTEEEVEERIAAAQSAGSEQEEPVLLTGEEAAASASRRVRAVFGGLLAVEKCCLTPRVVRSLIECASFANPEYYRAQKLRLSVYGKPRTIRCVEDLPEALLMPRGCLEDVRRELGEQGLELEIEDRRNPGRKIEVDFLGELREAQQKAFQLLSGRDAGVLCAPTAFGKTVVALKLIASRGVNTLILVHRKTMADQWRQRLLTFLSLREVEIGWWIGGKKKPTGIVDLATFQSLTRAGRTESLVEDYGHIVVDECHHVPAFSFEQVLRRAGARFVLGLTATPVRRDGHQPIITMQCGPILFRSTEREEARERPFDHRVVPRVTPFSLEDGEVLPIQALYDRLIHDEARNSLILRDIREAHAAGRCSLVLSERKDHLKILYEELSRDLVALFLLHGTLGRKRNRETVEALQAFPENKPVIVLATGRFIGEGFDEPRLDTLFLTLPISWKGTLQQYAGRLHRRSDRKSEVTVYDYVDARVGMLERMYRRRLQGYAGIGYTVEEDLGVPDTFNRGPAA